MIFDRIRLICAVYTSNPLPPYPLPVQMVVEVLVAPALPVLRLLQQVAAPVLKLNLNIYIHK